MASSNAESSVPNSSSFSIVGRVLTPRGLEPEAAFTVDGGEIASVGSPPAGVRRCEAGHLLVLPGVVDLHGDAFERQLMPRPGVHFEPRLALLDTDRQLVANGITTAFHALTYSWEPGLRAVDAGRALISALQATSGQLGCDTRLHLRWETYNLDVEDEVAGWLDTGTVALLAFNDHTPEMVRKAASDPEALLKYAERSSLSLEEFRDVLARAAARKHDVPAAIERLAAAARRCGVPMASHDDDSPDIRRWYEQLGCQISEFPKNERTARAAHDAGCDIVMGAPNIVRGGSHLSSVSAADMVAKGLCTVLSSDYYYPALLHAAFRLVRDGICPLPMAWRLVSENPARAAGLRDRGAIVPGRRADFILVDDSDPLLPRVAATFVAGRPVFSDRALFDQDVERLVA